MKNGFLVYDSDTHINPAAAEMSGKMTSIRRFARDYRNSRSIPSADQKRGRRAERSAQLSLRHKILPPHPGRGGAARELQWPRLKMDGQ